LAFNAEYVKRYVDPNPDGKLQDSLTWLYRRLKPAVRRIGAAINGNETVASAARQRLETDSTYQPGNLVEYLRKRPDSAPMG
jgi:hypothetical protein